jgi:biopolymer transport protein ExbD
MAIGGNLNKDDFSAPMAEINTTPLVDVMLVLLVIFLVTAPMLTQAIKLDLPNEKAQTINDQKPLVINIDAKGQFYLDSAPITEANLSQKLKLAASANNKQPLHIRADKNTPYNNVSKILALAQQNGLNNIGFITQPE